ncbi:hypothetical protein Dda_8484 [Drechslerella dactyloides]|uniref:Uncharacterized protein n=1 Tax=Drechslerella dactyloides TaxID=74499 RepID=A0AAD6IQI7_DREDA|nr:hypothetical protein Dda_8484 [Drechslerella dactyloides]
MMQPPNPNPARLDVPAAVEDIEGEGGRNHRHTSGPHHLYNRSHNRKQKRKNNRESKNIKQRKRKIKSHEKTSTHVRRLQVDEPSISQIRSADTRKGHPCLVDAKISLPLALTTNTTYETRREVKPSSKKTNSSRTSGHQHPRPRDIITNIQLLSANSSAKTQQWTHGPAPSSPSHQMQPPASAGNETVPGSIKSSTWWDMNRTPTSSS